MNISATLTQDFGIERVYYSDISLLHHTLWLIGAVVVTLAIYVGILALFDSHLDRQSARIGYGEYSYIQHLGWKPREDQRWINPSGTVFSEEEAKTENDRLLHAWYEKRARTINVVDVFTLLLAAATFLTLLHLIPNFHSPRTTQETLLEQHYGVEADIDYRNKTAVLTDPTGEQHIVDVKIINDRIGFVTSGQTEFILPDTA